MTIIMIELIYTARVDYLYKRPQHFFKYLDTLSVKNAPKSQNVTHTHCEECPHPFKL